MGVGAKLFTLAGPVLTYGIGGSIVVGLAALAMGAKRADAAPRGDRIGARGCAFAAHQTGRRRPPRLGDARAQIVFLLILPMEFSDCAGRGAGGGGAAAAALEEERQSVKMICVKPPGFLQALLRWMTGRQRNERKKRPIRRWGAICAQTVQDARGFYSGAPPCRYAGNSAHVHVANSAANVHANALGVRQPNAPVALAVTDG